VCPGRRAERIASDEKDAIERAVNQYEIAERQRFRISVSAKPVRHEMRKCPSAPYPLVDAPRPEHDGDLFSRGLAVGDPARLRCDQQKAHSVRQIEVLDFSREIREHHAAGVL
jgi:hypothetical protein